MRFRVLSNYCDNGSKKEAKTYYKNKLPHQSYQELSSSNLKDKSKQQFNSLLKNEHKNKNKSKNKNLEDEKYQPKEKPEAFGKGDASQEQKKMPSSKKNFKLNIRRSNILDKVV